MLTPYGPGKFNLRVDVIAYNASLDGADSSFGDCSENGFCVSLVSLVSEDHEDDDCDRLSAEDRAFLAEQRAAIVTENDQGFVTVEWFTLSSEAQTEYDGREEGFNASVPDEDDADECTCTGLVNLPDVPDVPEEMARLTLAISLLKLLPDTAEQRSLRAALAAMVDARGRT